MLHSLQIHAYNSKTHKIRRKLKTKYIGNKNKIKNNDQYLVYKPRLTLRKEFLNDNNDLKLTMPGCRLFQTLMIRSLKKVFSHVNTGFTFYFETVSVFKERLNTICMRENVDVDEDLLELF